MIVIDQIKKVNKVNKSLDRINSYIGNEIDEKTNIKSEG
jgi:hypothetical protein